MLGGLVGEGPAYIIANDDSPHDAARLVGCWQIPVGGARRFFHQSIADHAAEGTVEEAEQEVVDHVLYRLGNHHRFRPISLPRAPLEQTRESRANRLTRLFVGGHRVEGRGSDIPMP